MTDIAILAGGPQSLVPTLDSERFSFCEWVGVDRGTYFLLAAGRRPIRAFGDFDSVTPEEKALFEDHKLELTTFQKEKDKTDLELAVDWVIEEQPDRCFILGATGGRLDHGLLNVQLLYKGCLAHTEFILIDRQNTVILLKPGTYHINRTIEFPYLSFVAFSERITGITLTGLKYPLRKAELSLGSSLCVSNEVVGSEGEISFDTGLILMIRSSD